VRRDKIELVRLSSVRFENLLKFDSFTVTTINPVRDFIKVDIILGLSYNYQIIKYTNTKHTKLNVRGHRE